MSYLAHVLTEKSRNDLLEKFPPTHSRVICHHATEKYPASENVPYQLSVGAVIGVVDEDGIQALVVEINGNQFRPDGKRYHITLSIDEGKKPVESNNAIALYGFKSIAPVPFMAGFTLVK